MKDNDFVLSLNYFRWHAWHKTNGSEHTLGILWGHTDPASTEY